VSKGPLITAAFLAAGLGGCANTGSTLQSTPATVIRFNALESLPPMLERGLKRSGWESEFRIAAKTGQTSLNPTESWDESAAAMTFQARKGVDGPPVLLSPEESGVVLRRVRSELKDAVRAAGGEVVETVDTEAFREKTTTITYTIDRVAGTIKLNISAASDRAEETANRFVLTVREQAIR